jgi:hypothetical protein
LSNCKVIFGHFYQTTTSSVSAGVKMTMGGGGLLDGMKRYGKRKRKYVEPAYCMSIVPLSCALKPQLRHRITKERFAVH